MSPTTPDRKQTGTADAANELRVAMRDVRDETKDMPEAAVLAALGGGNPASLGDLRPGETVLDLGSGGGIDALFAAHRVGPTGRAYGLEPTDETLALAHASQAQLGIVNAEFLKGEIENIPLPDASVDVVIANGAINRTADKPRVLAEVFRVLRPGGRLSVSDTVISGALDARIRRRVETLIACLAGALEETQFRSCLAEAGFDGIEIAPAAIYGYKEMSALLADCGDDADEVAQAAAGRFMSAIVRATKSGRLV